MAILNDPHNQFALLGAVKKGAFPENFSWKSTFLFLYRS
jgi:hypothetical protein